MLQGVVIVFQQIAYFAETLAAVGVMLSLVYVGRQLKLTNAMSRSTVRQSLSGQMTDFQMSIASSPELAEAVAKMMYAGPVLDEVTEVERVQLVLCYAAIIERLHLAYEQQKDGILLPDEVDAIYPSENRWMKTPFLASLWPRLRETWPQDFAEWFDQRYRESMGSQLRTDED